MIDFVVRGTPKSWKAKSRKRWMAKVQQAVPPTAVLLTGPLRLRIDFFFDGYTNLDTDNIIKPIQDALQKVVYQDDETVTDVCSRKINLLRLPTIRHAPPELLFALAQPPADFVFIRVAAAYREVSIR